MISFLALVLNVYFSLNFCMTAGILRLYFMPSQCAIAQKISWESLPKVCDGPLAHRYYSHQPRMSQLRAWILALAASCVVLGAKIALILYWNVLMAFLGISTFSAIFPFLPKLRMILYPRKSKPSVIWVTLVFSSDSSSPICLIHTAVSFASFFLITLVETRLNAALLGACPPGKMQDYPLHV